MAYDHPFIDGNGRTARAFLNTETDDNDVTYFVLHQLDVILKAIDALYIYLDKKAEEFNAAEKLLQVSEGLQTSLNRRQMALIRHALKNPTTQYSIAFHQQSNRVTYQTARTDLLKLEELDLLTRKHIGRAFVFLVPSDLKKRIEKI